MASEESVIDWLLSGDPAIRWQVMRDLLDEPAETWERERRRTVESGWVAEMLEHRQPDGEWPAGRWTASTWVLLVLVALGLPEGHPAARAPIERLLDRFMPPGEEPESAYLLKRVDLCHLGFWLGLGAYFLDDDPRLPVLGDAVIGAQFEDGGWNCHMRNYPNTVHSSFHTTFNVLENLRIAAAREIVPKRALAAAEKRAVEFMLAHRLYRSDRTGRSSPNASHSSPTRGTGTTPSSAVSTTCASRLRSPTSDSPSRLTCCVKSASRTAVGRYRSAFPERCSSRWRSPARTVAGTRCGRSASFGRGASPPICKRPSKLAAAVGVEA